LNLLKRSRRSDEHETVARAVRFTRKFARNSRRIHMFERLPTEADVNVDA
jgi:hypothetical protein